MQEQGELNLMCPQHREKIISVSLTDTGENRMFCLRCLTQKQILIPQLAEYLTDLRQNKIKILMQQGLESQKRLDKLKKVFLNIKEQFNHQLDNIVKVINCGIDIKNQNIKQETEQLKQSIEQLNFTQVNEYISELKKQQLKQDDLFLKQDESIRNQAIQQYLDIQKSMNKQIQEGSNWKANVNINKLTQFQLLGQEQIIGNCYAMAMDKDQKILINGCSNEIQIWDFNSDGTIKLTQTMSGHSSTISCLCFSQKGYCFISGSWDCTMRIWTQSYYQWFCKEKYVVHQGWVNQIVLNSDEDQIISCSEDSTIKVWMQEKYKNKIQWKCVQKLTEHTERVRHLSLNSDSNLLATSGGYDQLRIWEKNNEQIWLLKQVIEYPNDYHLRNKFINNNELIVSTIKQGKMLRYIQNQGLFELKQQLKLNEIEDKEPYCFPIISNKQLGFAIVRHSKEFAYIFKSDNAELILHQTLSGDYTNGCIITDGKYLILQNFKANSIDILK